MATAGGAQAAGDHADVGHAWRQADVPPSLALLDLRGRVVTPLARPLSQPRLSQLMGMRFTATPDASTTIRGGSTLNRRRGSVSPPRRQAAACFPSIQRSSSGALSGPTSLGASLRDGAEGPQRVEAYAGRGQTRSP